MRVIGRVKKLRKDKGVSQRVLAEAIGISMGHMGSVESDKFPQKYTIPQLKAIAEYFSIPMHTLFMNYNEDTITVEECLNRVSRYLE